MYLNVYVPNAPARPRGGLVLPVPPRAPVCLVGADGADEPGLRRLDRGSSRSEHGVSPDDVQEGAAQGRHGQGVPGSPSTREEGVVFIGKAQEKTRVCPHREAAESRDRAHLSVDGREHGDGQPVLLLLRGSGLRSVLPQVLLATSPTTASCCINGHEYVKRQLDQRGIRYEALDNGILSCADPRRLQRLCDGLSAEKIDALLRKWLRRLPHPFTREDRRAGYRYDVSILQAEFSLTQVLDRPATGRVFFEEVIRENLDLGRPDQVQLIFDRRVIRKHSRAVSDPRHHRGRHSIAAHRLQALADQAVPQGGTALRTETTINDPRTSRSASG